jgi:CrcB protein
MSALAWLGVGVLGGSGAVLRFLVDGFVAGRVGTRFPWGTFVVNISGAFLLGLVTELALHGVALVLVGAALLGSFTTVSTWMLETDRSVEDGRVAVAVVNVVLTMLAGASAAELGRLLGAL